MTSTFYYRAISIALHILVYRMLGFFLNRFISNFACLTTHCLEAVVLLGSLKDFNISSPAHGYSAPNKHLLEHFTVYFHKTHFSDVAELCKNSILHWYTSYTFASCSICVLYVRGACSLETFFFWDTIHANHLLIMDPAALILQLHLKAAA